MDHLSARRQRLWEAMESCRSGSDDLSDPQFADLAARLAEDAELRGQFQRLQEADGAIKAAFAQVPVPAGLADRVSRRLAEAAPGAAEQREPGAESFGIGTAGFRPCDTRRNTPDFPTPLREPAGRFSRRRLLVGFTAAVRPRPRSVGRRFDPDSPAPARDADFRARRGHGLLRQGQSAIRRARCRRCLRRPSIP